MGIEERMIDEGIERLRRFTNRDTEFERHFGQWTRPEHLPRYKLEKMKHLIQWSRVEEGIIECAPFIRALNEIDRVIAAEIAKFTYEQFEGKPASDKILNDFRNHFLRLLDLCGF